MIKPIHTQVQRILSDVISISPQSFKLTMVQKLPKRNQQSKIVKLTCFDFHNAFNPQSEYNRIRECLNLPKLAIKDNSEHTKMRIAPHTLHLLIPFEEIKAIPDYPKLLATIGYFVVIDKEGYQLFINKRKPEGKSTFYDAKTAKDDSVETNALLC